jgi:hypothetical protein
MMRPTIGMPENQKAYRNTAGHSFSPLLARGRYGFHTTLQSIMAVQCGVYTGAAQLLST